MRTTTIALALAASASTSNAAEVVTVAVTHPASGVEALAEELQVVSDPTSPRYGQWLSSDEVAALLAVPQSAIDKALAWASAECGAEALSHEVTGQGDFLRMEVATADCAAKLVDEAAVARGAGVVDGAFPSGTSTTLAAASPSRGGARRFGVGENAPSISDVGAPNEQKAAYGIPTDLENSAQNDNLQLVWGPGTFGYLPSDLKEFYKEYDLPEKNLLKVNSYGFSGTPGGDNFGEASLDVTYISSMGLGVETLVANTNESSSTEETTGFGYALLSFANMLATAGDGSNNTLPLPKVVSMSLGSLSYDSCATLCEQTAATSKYSLAECNEYMTTQRQVCMYSSGELVDRINTEFMKTVARGTTMLAATGDGGSHFSFGAFTDVGIGAVLNEVSCEYQLPTFPAESPYVLGVGGSQWTAPASSKRPVYWYAGGAGFSRRFAMPDYQADAVASYLASGVELPPATGYNQSMRAYPDVVALAWGTPMYDNGNKVTTGGTSASTPSFAGIVSLLNGIRLDAGLPSLGFLQPRLYAAAAADEKGEMFYDITTGYTNVGGDYYDCGNGFRATSSWDPVTGWGSPRWEGLVAALTVDE